jgi:hypothetical protein
MDDKLRWYGGVSNRQILIDSVRALAIWLAFSVPVFALLWWLGFRSYVGVAAAVAGLLGYRFIKWRRRA